MKPSLAAVWITAGAIALRVAFVLWMAATPGFEWIDPDGYLEQARRFADGRFVDAFRYADFFKAPLYPVFLSPFTGFQDAFPLNAALVQAVLAGSATLGVHALACRLAGARLAIGAAAAYALFFPDVMALMTFMQERVYLPLLILALAVLVWALDQRDRPWRLLAAGAGLGLAALGRSMPLYFTVVVAVWLFLTARERPAGFRGAAALVGGFALVTLPFTWWISAQAGHLVLIENIGSYGLARLAPDGREYFGDELPTVFSTVAFLWHRFAADPLGWLHELLTIVGGMFQVPGGSWLEEHGHARSLWQAGLMKVYAHTGGDLLFVAAAVLAPFGLARSRASGPAAVLGLWIVTHLLFTALAGYGGQRFRQPLDAPLLVLAAAALATASPGLRGWRIGAASMALVPVAIGVSSSWRESLAARSDYGVLHWQTTDEGRTAEVKARSGFNVTPPGPAIELELRRSEDATSARVTVIVDGYPLREIDVGPIARRVAIARQRHRVFVELTTGPPASAEGVALIVHAAGHR